MRDMLWGIVAVLVIIATGFEINDNAAFEQCVQRSVTDLETDKEIADMVYWCGALTNMSDETIKEWLP